MRKRAVKVVLVLTMALVLRLIFLDQSLWLDEAVTAKVIREFSFFEIITRFSPNDFHPPLFYFLMKLWTKIFGYSEIALRMPSVIFSLLTGYLLYLIGRKIKDEITGFWAMMFFLFNPLIIYYSQEARMYMMVTFLLTIAIFYLLKSLRVNKLTSLLLFNLFSTLAFYTFYGSVFLILAMMVYLLIKRRYKFFLFSILFFIFYIVLISPLLYQQFVNAKISLANVVNWNLVLGQADLKNLLLIPVKFFVGRISFYPKWLYWLIAGGWTIFILYQISNVKHQKYTAKIKNIYPFYYLLIFSLILGLVTSFFTPLLQYFRFLYLLSIISLILAFSGKSSLFDWKKMITFLGFLIFSMIYLFNPVFHREDWKNLAKNLPKYRKIYMILPSSDPLTYYLPDLSIKELRTLNEIELEKEIVVIPYTAEIYGFDYQKKLKDKGFVFKKRVDFRKVWYEIWVRNKDYAFRRKIFDTL